MVNTSLKSLDEIVLTTNHNHSSPKPAEKLIDIETPVSSRPQEQLQELETVKRPSNYDADDEVFSIYGSQPSKRPRLDSDVIHMTFLEDNNQQSSSKSVTEKNLIELSNFQDDTETRKEMVSTTATERSILDELEQSRRENQLLRQKLGSVVDVVQNLSVILNDIKKKL